MNRNPHIASSKPAESSSYRYRLPALSPPRATRVPRRAGYEIGKRALDIFLSLVGLVLLAPLFVWIAIRIKCDSPGAVLYRRRVLRQQSGGDVPPRTFEAWKFRTMIADAEMFLNNDPVLLRLYEREYKLSDADDPRVTRMGAYLRAWNLDELPQLVNVLCGQMSLVGPRIISPPELSRYGDHQAELLRVKPGITGWWQVNGRHRVRYEERVQLDIWYIEHRSTGLDLLILLRTAWYLLVRRGNFEH